MADSLGRDALDAQAITAAFAGNASATARELGVPCKVVVKAVRNRLSLQPLALLVKA